MSKHKHCDKQ